jgi:transcriptional regulator with XRE-family HTH domain
MTDRADAETPDLEPLAALGEAIRALRTRANLSQEELARRGAVEATALAAFEAGREEPTWGDLRRLAHALGTSLERLLQVAEDLESGDQRGLGPRA